MVGDNMVTRFDPVEFIAGDGELDDNYALYLDKLSTLLKERPKLEMNICGIPSELDRQALSSQQQDKSVEITNDHLIQLAEQRGQVVKSYLIEAGIDAGRLYTCHPEMTEAEMQSPIVELHL